MSKKYYVSIECSWMEEIRADSPQEAVKIAENKFVRGKGRFPREFVEVRYMFPVERIEHEKRNKT